MLRRGETWRFYLPVAALTLLAVYSTQKLVRAHVDPDVTAPDYRFKRQIPARRGSIYSSYGTSYPFVKSVPYWEYRLDPVALSNAVAHGTVRRPREKPRTAKAILKTVADALGLNYKAVLAMNENVKNRYQFLAMSSDPDSHRTLANSKLVAGVAIDERQVRQYLHARRLCHVLGSINAEYVGSAGLELRYQKELAGTPGTVLGLRDANGRELYDKRINSIEPVDGADIYLTVDHNIQYEAEDALKWGLTEYGAGSGWCIVMDPKTGRILAMCSFPDFLPDDFGKASDSAKMNRAVAFNFEPGSVMKVITAAAAIDSGFASPSRLYSTNRNDPNYYRLPGDGSHVWEPYMTVGDAIVHSSNIVIGKLGYDMKPKLLWTYMKRFGFGAKTGVELPGEQFGILRDYRKWDKATWSRAAIGQGVSVTAIQLIGAYQAIANDGIRLRPRIVEKIVASDGREIYASRAEELGRPIRPETARQMRRVMRDVASPKGTARRAAIKGYSVAGKTGTAQKTAGGGYLPGLYRASFCGIVPAEKPRLVVLVTLDFDAHTRYHQGGNSAGPVFRRLTTAALRYLMVPPDRPDELADADEEDDECLHAVERRTGLAN